MPEHRPPHRRDAARQDLRRVRPDMPPRKRSWPPRAKPWSSDLTNRKLDHDNLHRRTQERPPGRRPGGLDLAKMLLEGRAFFALIVIIVVFSLLSPNYFTVDNFLTMASHVAIYGLLGDRHAAGHPQRRHRPLGRLDAGPVRRRRRCADAGRAAEVRSVRHPLPAGLGRRRSSPARSAPSSALVNGVLIARFKVPAVRRDAGHALRRARHRAADDQRADLQQPRRPSRAGQHRLRLARLQPHRSASRSAYRAGRRRDRRASLVLTPHRLRPLALRLGRQRARGRAVGRAGQAGEDLGLRALRRLRRHRRADPLLAADLGRPDRRHVPTS